MFAITRSFTFAAAHHLTQVADNHKCRRNHGHNYTVILEASASNLDHGGMVVDYQVLDVIAANVRARWDHQDLNEVCGFETTAENLAFDVWNTAYEYTEMVTAVTVNESDKSTATYRA